MSDHLGPNNAINIGEWLIGGGGRLERFYVQLDGEMRLLYQNDG